MKATYKLITPNVKITLKTPKGTITFDSDTAKVEDYEFYYNAGFSSCFVKTIQRSPIDFKQIKQNKNGKDN